MLTVHVRVNDASGKPTPVRVRFLDAQGVYRAPLGRLAEFRTGAGQDVGGHLRLGDERFAYIDGTCEIPLPAGAVTALVSRGPEHVPLVREVRLAPGKLALRLAIERWADLRAEGWCAGDTRAHDLTPHAALLEGAAEGLAVVNVLARERPSAQGEPAGLPDLLAFSGTRPALESPDCVVVVNTLNAHPLLGTVGLLNCHRAVYPLRFGAPDHPDNWSVADWCDQCHRKRGLVVWPDLPRLSAEQPQGEALACLVLGKIDAFEVCNLADPATLADWYRLLDCGLRVPLAGASGKDSNRIALGATRTYARLSPGEPFGYGAWVEAVRAGRTFATSGPLLSLSADGQGPGALLPRASGDVVRVRAEARSAWPFERLEIVVGGAVVAGQGTGAERSAAVEAEVAVTASTWVAARCVSRDNPAGHAHTSPVYLEVVGRPLRPAPAVVEPLLAILERTSSWVAGAARCETERQRAHLGEVLAAGRADLQRRAAAGASASG
jgi:hypothetical protein